MTLRGRGVLTADNSEWLKLVRQPEGAQAETVWTQILQSARIEKARAR